MVLEATIIIIDNSECMRNGDFSPNRFEACKDAVNLITGTKTNSNPESTVGLLSNAGSSIRMLATLTTDPGRIVAAMHNSQIGGEASFVEGIQVAQLGLKHRQNKRQEQRIVAFVGSPISQSVKEVERLGKRLKKNKVAVDIIALGDENEEKLQAFHNAVNNNDNSHFVTIPPGPGFIADALLSSPIVTSSMPGGAAPANPNTFEFGVDPNVEPELALALRLSMEEENKRKEAAQANNTENADASGDTEMKDATPATTEPADAAPAAAEPTVAEATGQEMDEDDEDDLLQQALALSMMEYNAANAEADAGQDDMDVDEDGDEDDEDDELQKALQMSLADHNEPAAEKTDDKKEASADNTTPDLSAITGDQELLASMIADLPGVDPNDPNIKNILDQMSGDKKKDEEKK